MNRSHEPLKVGTVRCAVRAAFSGATVPTAATRAGTSQRGVPTKFRFIELFNLQDWTRIGNMNRLAWVGRVAPCAPSSHCWRPNISPRSCGAQRTARPTFRFMARLFLALFVLLCASGFIARAATPAEDRDFNSAARTFKDEMFERAEKEFAEFNRKYPDSLRLPEAVFLQARSLFERQKTNTGPQGAFSSVVSLLATNIARAGTLADQYRYWIGETQFHSGDYRAAADSFAQLIKDYADSPLVLNASYAEAFAWYKSGNLVRTIELLQKPASAFQRASQTRLNDDFTVKGFLLLAEALFAQHDFKATETTLSGLANRVLKPEQKWQRQYLLARLQLANRRTADALQTVTNLLTLSAAVGAPKLQAETKALEGEIFQELQQTASAIAAYTNNLAPSMPDGYQRQALLKIIDLTLGQGNLDPAVQWLETFLAKKPQDPLLDLVRFTLGELRLKQYYQQLENRSGPPEVAPTAANLLAQARAQFSQVITNYPQSGLLGKAHFDRAWCFWEERKYKESRDDFKAASEILATSEEQAVARFKLADVQFLQKDFAGAITNYSRLVEEYSVSPQVKEGLLPQALYQIVLASSEVGDHANATNALEKIQAWFPESEFNERSALLAGHTFARQQKPAEARAVLEKFIERFPDSPLLPEVRREVARTFMLEGKWQQAALHYDAWVAQFTNHEELPQAEFDRAWVYYQAGQETNAFNLFSNYVTRFPASPLAALAQNWMADYFTRKGDPVNAERNYQLLYQSTNFPPSALKYQALLRAGASALARQGYDDAIAYFTNLIDIANYDSNCPPTVAAQAYFALGDAIIEKPVAERTDPMRQRFEVAINAFRAIRAILVNYPTNSLVPLAFGRIGDCYFQLGVGDPARYEGAVTNYQEVIKSPGASASARSQAEVGLGNTLEKKAEWLEKQTDAKAVAERENLFDEALNHYLDVLYEKNLRDGEEADPVWIGKAGLEAGRLSEQLKNWDKALNIYSTLMERLPVLRPVLEKKIEKARANLPREKK
ncbi:MAG: tetratricopeptide repeat protein [Verrucomicrobiota bacterium]